MRTISASSTIYNPYYIFPEGRVAVYPPIPQSQEVIIVEPTRISLLNNNLTLLFHDAKITFFSQPDIWNKLTAYAVQPIQIFASFQTFIEYNLLGGPDRNSENLMAELSEAKTITFNLGKYVRRERGEILLGRKQKVGWDEIEPCTVELTRDHIEDFLRKINDHLYLAMVYFLRGCQHIEYFLFEYYKAIEAVKNYFTSEKEMTEALKPYGFRKRHFDDLKRYANDEQKPLSIGRHAPKKGIKLLTIDPKHIFEHQVSREIFEQSFTICREVIQTFFEYVRNT